MLVVAGGLQRLFGKTAIPSAVYFLGCDEVCGAPDGEDVQLWGGSPVILRSALEIHVFGQSRETLLKELWVAITRLSGTDVLHRKFVVNCFLSSFFQHNAGGMGIRRTI
jgi:hypothetical protein